MIFLFRTKKKCESGTSPSQEVPWKLPHSQDSVLGFELGGAWEAAFKIACRVTLWPLFVTQESHLQAGNRGPWGQVIGIPNWSDLLTRAAGFVSSFWLCLPFFFFFLFFCIVENFKHCRSREDIIISLFSHSHHYNQSFTIPIALPLPGTPPKVTLKQSPPCLPLK